MEAKWVKSDTGRWLPLRTFDVENASGSGVYVIWHGGIFPRIVRIGRGDIKTRLLAERDDAEVVRHGWYATLYVTWAILPASYQKGVERYLVNRWPPRVADTVPDVHPIAVNAPW
jgi:hypothetical protein